MAGYYPDVPNRRRAYDRDGSLVFAISVTSGQPVHMSSSVAHQLNSENNGDCIGWGGGPSYGPASAFGVVFPQAVDLVGYFVGGWHESPGGSHESSTMSAVATSVDSTNGLDGSWVGHGNYTMIWPITPEYRTDITLLAVSGIKAVRFTIDSPGAGSTVARTCHLFTTAYTSVLRLWHPTSSAELTAAYFDWGDVAQGETYERTFRVHNTDPSRTATGITVGTDVLSDGAVPIGAQITYSDGGAFATSINIGDLAPGATSGVITVRYTVASGADIGPWAWRTVAEPATLT